MNLADEVKDMSLLAHLASAYSLIWGAYQIWGQVQAVL